MIQQPVKWSEFQWKLSRLSQDVTKAVSSAMRYDLRLIGDVCRQTGFPVQISGDQRVEIDLGHGAVLCFSKCRTRRRLRDRIFSAWLGTRTMV